MFTYENGILFAFLLWIIGVVRVIILSNSRAQKNLEKIGKRISYNLGMIVDITYDQESKLWTITKFILLHILLPLPFVMLSWVYVVFSVIFYIYVFLKDLGAPQNIKEFRWKLRNTDLTLDQLIMHLIKINDHNPNDFESIKKELVENIRYRKQNGNTEHCSFKDNDTFSKLLDEVQPPPIYDYDSIDEWVGAIYEFYEIKFPQPFYITKIYGFAPNLADYESIESFENNVKIYSDKIRKHPKEPHEH